jgi:ribose/xylose/arabinose/galactoside ABC-type transport system permease subunit
MQVRFTLRRAILATTLIATGMAAWPLMQQIEMNSGLEEALMMVCVVSLFALPGAGVGCLFGRVIPGLIAGLAFGVMLLLLLPRVE